MKEIVERLQENRQVELAKSILESNGYRVTKDRLEESTHDKYTTAQHIEDIKNFLSLPMQMSLSWYDMKSNPRDTDYSQEYFDEVESMLEDMICKDLVKEFLIIIDLVVLQLYQII